ncbi:MAG TPA: DUF4870 domain-containing protein [Flavobacterium sp.]|nr:DUF4870 domain-containing protein [Flavobacterium sp.]
METTNSKNTATLTHLSTFSQYFFPFGNFILPLIIWSSAKKNSEFVDKHGRQAINFQLSIFLYTLILCLIAIPVLLFTIFKNVPFRAMVNGDDFFIDHFNAGNITGIVVVAVMAVMVFFLMKVAEFFLVIYASVKAANGEEYEYPMTIKFIKADKIYPTEMTEPDPSPLDEQAQQIQTEA